MIDSNGASASVTHSLTVGNLPPVAKLKASPATALVGQTVNLNASESTDQGTITDYKWDLSGEAGKYETDTGTTPTVTTSFKTPGTHTVGVEVTDNQGLSAQTTIPVTVLEQAAADYSEAVLGTPGLIDYYKLDEAQGPTILDSQGLSSGTIAGGTFGLPGAVQKSTAVGFNGSSDSGSIPLNLSGTSQLTIEFWLKWNQYANNDALAMEFTPNFNENAGGFLVDPNAGEYGGTFGIGIGDTSNRNSVFFTRAQRWCVASLRDRDRHDRGGRQRDHTVRRRPARQLPAGKRRNGTGGVRELDPVPILARRQLTVRSGRAGRTGDLQPAAQLHHDFRALPLQRRRHRAGALVHGQPVAGRDRSERDLQRLRLDRLAGHDHRLQVGPERQRQIRNRHRHQPDAHPCL